MNTIENQIAQLVKDAEELKRLKENKKNYMRDYMREKRRQKRAEELGVPYEEYVKEHLPNSPYCKGVGVA